MKITSIYNHIPHLLLIITLLLLAPLTSHAYNSNHGPYTEYKKPTPIPMTKCERMGRTEVDNGRIVIRDFQDTTIENSPIVRWRDGEGTISLLSHDKEVIIPLSPLVNRHYRPRDVFSHDFNQDGKIDFHIYCTNGGAGLATLRGSMVFILSNDTGYRMTQFFYLGNTPTDLVDLTGKGDYRYIHSTFIDGPEGRDGKHHNYWIYHMLKFKDDTLFEDTKAQGFPRWIWYTFKENHQETTQLTPTQKETLWKQEVDQEPSLNFTHSVSK